MICELEYLARELCKLCGINPDQETSGLTKETKAVFGDRSYKLWEYWEEFYVKPILEMSGN